MIKISVPGKIHLLGEHAVVYGKPALLSAINLKVNLTIGASRQTLINVFHKSFVETKATKEKLNQLLRILEDSIRQRFAINNFPFYEINVDSEIPIGSGLGSSAAISVAITHGILKLMKIKHSKDDIYHIACQGEKFFHGNASGADVAAVLYGGFLWFRKEAEFLKLFSPLCFSGFRNIKNFFLINSGMPVESTKEMVEMVKSKIKNQKSKVEVFLKEQEILTKIMVRALRDDNEQMLMESVKEGEKNLEILGVVGGVAKKMIREIEKIGGVAKLSGAGGVKGGSGILLVYHNNSDKISALARENGWEIMKIKLGDKGLK